MSPLSEGWLPVVGGSGVLILVRVLASVGWRVEGYVPTATGYPETHFGMDNQRRSSRWSVSAVLGVLCVCWVRGLGVQGSGTLVLRPLHP